MCVRGGWGGKAWWSVDIGRILSYSYTQLGGVRTVLLLSVLISPVVGVMLPLFAHGLTASNAEV